MTNPTQVKEEQTSVVRDPSTQVNNSEGGSGAYQVENLTLEQVANEVEESRRLDLLKSYLLQLSSREYLEQSDVVSDANHLRKLVRSEDTQVQTKVAELLLQYVRLMKVNTTYETKLGGIQDSMLLYKLYQVVHDDSCHYLLPNLKAGEVFSKFLCTLLATASSEYIFNSVVKLYQRTVQNILGKYKRDSGSVEEMSTDDARVVIAVMKMLLTLTRSFGAPPAPAEVLCSLSVAVVSSTKAHLCRLYSYNLMAFLIKDITDKQTIDKMLNGLDAAQRNQVTSLVKESTSLNNTCNWKFKHAPADSARRKQNDQTAPNNANLQSSPGNRQAVEVANQAQNESARQQKASAKDWERTPSRNYMNALTQNSQSRKLQSPLPGGVPRSPQSISRYNGRSGTSSSNSSVIYRSGDDGGNGHSSKDKDTYDQRRQKNSLGTPSRTSAQEPLPSNWYRDLFKTFDTNRGEGKNAVVDKNAWKLKNDQLMAALTLLEKQDKVDLEGVSAQFVNLFELLLKNESAIPVVVNSLNLFTMLLVKSECDLLTVSKSHALSDLLVQKLKDSNKKVRDACVQALVEVTKRCRLTVVSESVKKALSNVSPTCRENMCNFLNGKVVPTSDADFFEKLKQLLTILADHIRQIRTDKVPRVRSALGALVDVLDDFDLVYANRPATAGPTEDTVTQVAEGAKSTANEFVLTGEQQASLVIEDSDRAPTRVNTTSGNDTTTVTSYYDAESGSEFNVPQLDQEPAKVAAAQPARVAPSGGAKEAVGGNAAPRDAAAAAQDQEVKTEPSVTANAATRVSFADQSAKATRRVAQADRASESGSGQGEDEASRTVTPASAAAADPRRLIDQGKMIALSALRTTVDQKVLDEFRTNDVPTLNRALGNLTKWMESHSRAVKVFDFYLLRLAREYHRDFKEPEVLQKFYTLVCKEELSDEALKELMAIVKKYKEPMVMVSLMLTNNVNIERFLNPVNAAYSMTLPMEKKLQPESTEMCDGNQMVLSVFQTIITTVSRQYLAIDEELQLKIMDFLVHFVKTGMEPYSTRASEALWVLEDAYGVFKYMDDRQLSLVKFSRPSKELKAACSASESRLRKYLSSELYSCMFDSDHERKKKACSFWKGYLGNSNRKRDEMMMSDSRKDLIAWLACCLFESRCERVAIELFEMMVDYLETKEQKFTLEESKWLAECFLSYATFANTTKKSLEVFTRVSKMMTYSLEIARTMCSYLEHIEIRWVDAIKETLEEVARVETADHELYAYITRNLMSNSDFRNSIDEAKTLVNSETSSLMNGQSPLEADCISHSEAMSLLVSQVAATSMEMQGEAGETPGIKRTSSSDSRADPSGARREVKRSAMDYYLRLQLEEQMLMEQLYSSPRTTELQQQYRQQQQQLYDKLDQLRQERQQNPNREVYSEIQKLRQEHKEQTEQFVRQLEEEQCNIQQQKMMQRIEQFEEEQKRRRENGQAQESQEEELDEGQISELRRVIQESVYDPDHSGQINWLAQLKAEQLQRAVQKRHVRKMRAQQERQERQARQAQEASEQQQQGQGQQVQQQQVRVQQAQQTPQQQQGQGQQVQQQQVRVQQVQQTPQQQGQDQQVPQLQARIQQVQQALLQKAQVQKAQRAQQVDPEVAGRMVQRVVSNAQARVSNVREASLASAGQTLKDLNEKYKKPTASLETLTTNPSLEAVETLRTNRSNSSRTEERDASNEFGQLPQQAGSQELHQLRGAQETEKEEVATRTENAAEVQRDRQQSEVPGDQSKVTGVKEASERVEQAQLSKSVVESVERWPQVAAERVLQLRQASSEEVAARNLMEEVILGEDVTMDLESCRSLSQQIVEKPVHRLEQQPRAPKPKYMSATLEETRYVFVGDSHGSDKKATAEDAEQGVHGQSQGDKSKKRRKLNTGDARKEGREEEEEEVADRREKRTNEEASLRVVQNLEDEDEESEEQEPRRKAEGQKSASASRLIDKEPSKYHPYIQSLTGNLAPAVELEQENECSSSDDRVCLDTVSADAKEGRDSNEGTATRSESRSLVDMAGYEEEQSAKKPFSANAARAVDFVDSDPDCLREELGLNLVETVLSLCSRVNDVCLVSSYREYQSLLPTLYPADVPATLAQTFGQVLRHRGALKGTFLRLLTAPLLEASHNALLLLTKLAYKSVQAGESTAGLLGAIMQALEVFRLVTGRLQEKSVLRFCNVVTNLLALPKVLFQDEKLYSLVSSLVSENALKQPKSVMYKLLDVMIEVSMESLGGELDRLMMAKLRFTKILQMQILVGLRSADGGFAPESEALRQKHMAFISRLESYLRTSRAQNVDNVIRTSNYILRTI